MKVSVHKVQMNAPNDISGLRTVIESGQILDPNSIVAIMGKTEGNGCVNDFTRGYAVSSIQNYLKSVVTTPVEKDKVEEIVMVMSGGTEGVLSPHLTIFTVEEALMSSPNEVAGLTVGVHHTRDFLPEEIGTLAMVKVVAEGVKAAMESAMLYTGDNVHFVQIKCPLVTSSSSSSTSANGRPVTTDSYKSMAYSRAASALGAAVAVGELTLDQITNGTICADYSLYSSVASTSAGVELMNCEILVLGNSKSSMSEYVIGHSVMEHALDTASVERAMPSNGDKIVQVLAKAEADPTGRILGCRHTMMEDSDINHTRMARAVVGAVLAGAVKDPMIYVSGGAEHQGPSGGGTIAIIASKKKE
jgi:cyanuric acid amidohydrolase